MRWQDPAHGGACTSVQPITPFESINKINSSDITRAGPVIDPLNPEQELLKLATAAINELRYPEG